MRARTRKVAARAAAPRPIDRASLPGSMPAFVPSSRRSCFGFRLARALGLIALIAGLGGCEGDHLPRFARPVPTDAGQPDASAPDEDGGTITRDR
jgi:hypothetical protein